jgi:MFS family permease
MSAPETFIEQGGASTQIGEARSLSELSPQQWRSGIAAWLGWMFDGLDMHLYTLVAAPFLVTLLHVTSTSDPLVKQYSSWIQAAFLVGWALGGGFFGRIGDKLGRSRALSLTILTYACFTGLSFFAATWWHLLIFRFMAALGIGGEWAVGSSLLSETWPRRWRPWVAAVLQTGVNIGVLFACLTNFAFAGVENKKWVFLVGIVPAFLVYWIRKKVPEPAEWHAAKQLAGANQPSVLELFRGDVLGITLKTIFLCAFSLTAWWAFMFWNLQHLRNLPDWASWTSDDRERYVSISFFTIIAVSSFGNFFAAWLAKRLGYKRSLSLMCFGFFVAFLITYSVPRDHASMMFWGPVIGFFSGIFGLFTMYLPPLFPTLLRTTGAGFCYNIGRIAAAFGTVFFGLFSKVGDFRTALLYAGFLFIPAGVVALFMPDSTDGSVSR